uniref:Uncharacterized protein n=1 Tax=viral metagenome TaxID=1070528 RepID=A0A6C0DJ04_9ZZZZ
MDIDFTSRTGESQKRSVAMGLADAAAKKVNETNAANNFVEENKDAFEKFDSLPNRGGKYTKKRKSKRNTKKSRKQRKSKKHRKHRK